MSSTSSSSQSLNGNKRARFTEKRYNYSCDQCASKFTLYKQLQNHKRRHETDTAVPETESDNNSDDDSSSDIDIDGIDIGDIENIEDYDQINNDAMEEVTCK